MLPTSNHEVPCENPAEGGIQLMTVRRFIAKNLPLSQYDLNYVEGC